MTNPTPVRHWWSDAVVYQLYVRSFADANGDGIGDLEGIRSRLPYLARLGVDAVWLTPCFPSPQVDHGYDVADYMGIEPDYGTLDDFDRLIADAKAHGLKILLDVVANHCSSEHAWFKAAVAAGPGSPERERFWFRDGKGDGSLPPNNWQAWFGGPAWTRVTEPDGSPGQWYLHLFTPEQPDWNWTNPDVVQYFDDTLMFWFDRGVEGFRIDAAIVLGKVAGLPDAPPLPPDVRPTDAAGRNPYHLHQPEGHEVWRRWRRLTEQYAVDHPGRDLYFVGEAYSPDPDTLLSYVRPDEMHAAFAFDVMLTGWHAPSLQRRIDDTLVAMARSGASLPWTFNNHDTERSVTRYGRTDATDPSKWSFNNLVPSDAPVDLEVGTRRGRAMALVLGALPGAAYIYQGEELGLPEILDIPPDRRQDPIFFRSHGAELGRDGCRVPLPWTDDQSTAFGFSARPGAEPWMPQPSDWWAWSAAREDVDPASMLSLYRTVLAERRARGLAPLPFAWRPAPGPSALAFDRGHLTMVLNTGEDGVILDAAFVAGRRVVLSSVPGHDDPTVVPSDAAVWLAP